MPVDLSRLRRPIPTSSAPDLDAADDRLVAIDSLAQKGRFEAASAKVEELLAEGIYDIRPLPYHLYRAFEEDGFRALALVLEVTVNLLGPSFAAMGPSRRKEDLFSKRLGWLFDKVEKAIEYHEKRATPEWAAWEATLTAEATDRALAAGARTAELMAAEVYGPAAMSLGLLLARIRRQAAALRSAAPAEAPARSAAAPGGIPAVSPPGGGAGGAASGGAAAEPHHGEGARRMDLVVSHSFLDLCRRLQAFESLVQKQRFDRAAVLADDLARAIEAFDPTLCFPELFARYVALRSKHVATLVRHGEQRESPAWRALEQYCRVDLTGFVEGDP